MEKPLILAIAAEPEEFAPLMRKPGLAPPTLVIQCAPNKAADWFRANGYC